MNFNVSQIHENLYEEVDHTERVLCGAGWKHFYARTLAVLIRVFIHTILVYYICYMLLYCNLYKVNRQT